MRARSGPGSATRSAPPARTDAPATYAIIGDLRRRLRRRARRAAAPARFDGGGKIISEGGLFGPLVADGEPYRIVTSAFLHAGLLHLGLNMFALYILGTLLEPAIGTARFVGIYVVSILGGSFGALLLDPNELTVGASGGIFGLMAAAFLIARNRGLDELASQIGFFVVLNLVFTFSIPNISIGGHLGGLIGGALAALLINALERGRSAQRERARGGRPGRPLRGRRRRGADRRRLQRAGRARLRRAQRRAELSSTTSRCRSRAAGHELGVEQVGEQLDPVDEPRARARERGGGVDRDHAPRRPSARSRCAAARAPAPPPRARRARTA